MSDEYGILPSQVDEERERRAQGHPPRFPIMEDALLDEAPEYTEWPPPRVYRVVELWLGTGERDELHEDSPQVLVEIYESGHGYHYQPHDLTYGKEIGVKLISAMSLENMRKFAKKYSALHLRGVTWKKLR